MGGGVGGVRACVWAVVWVCVSARECEGVRARVSACVRVRVCACACGCVCVGGCVGVCPCSEESVLFIGTQFSILYTFMYSPA